MGKYGKEEGDLCDRACDAHEPDLTDGFYSIGIHDFDKQLSDFRAVSVPIPGCEVKLEFGYVALADVPISGSGKSFLKEVKRAA